MSELKQLIADLVAITEDTLSKLKPMADEAIKLESKEQLQKSKPWPQVGDEYWYVNYLGARGKTVHSSHEFDHYLLSTGNCHRSEAEALAYREWQTDPRVVARGMIERMEGFDPQGPYRVLWVYREDKGLTVVFSTENRNGGLCFESNSFGELDNLIRDYPDLCKVALGVITDKEEAGRIVREAMGK